MQWSGKRNVFFEGVAFWTETPESDGGSIYQESEKDMRGGGRRAVVNGECTLLRGEARKLR